MLTLQLQEEIKKLLTNCSKSPFFAKSKTCLIQSGVSPCPLTPFLIFLTFLIFFFRRLRSPISLASRLFMVLLWYPPLLFKPLVKSSKLPRLPFKPGDLTCGLGWCLVLELCADNPETLKKLTLLPIVLSQKIYSVK